VLLALSFLPSQSLVGRFMSAAGEARSGSVTSLVAELPQRLRLAGAGLLALRLPALVAGVVLVPTTYFRSSAGCSRSGAAAEIGGAVSAGAELAPR
jgi:hypothetical protein